MTCPPNRRGPPNSIAQLGGPLKRRKQLIKGNLRGASKRVRQVNAQFGGLPFFIISSRNLVVSMEFHDFRYKGSAINHSH
jgi:hypothetical protein